MKAILFRNLSGLSVAKLLGDGYSVPIAAAIAAAGSGYQINDVVTVAGSGVYTQPSTWRVAAVSGTGAVVQLDVIRPGVATTKPSNPAATTTSGSGIGLTLTIAWRDESIPAGTRYALVQAELKDVRWRDDGGTPDATTGHLLAAGDSLPYDMDSIGSLRLIETEPSALLNVTFYG